MNPLVELAAGEYELEKPAGGTRITMRIMAKRFGLKPDQLKWYFANLYRGTPPSSRGLYRGHPPVVN